MNQIRQNAGHLAMATLVVGAAVALCIVGRIDSATAVALIGLATGTSLGGGLALLSNTGTTTTPVVQVPVQAVVHQSPSPSTDQAIETPGAAIATIPSPTASA